MQLKRKLVLLVAVLALAAASFVVPVASPAYAEGIGNPGTEGIGVCSGCVCVVCRTLANGEVFCIEYDLCN